MEEDQSTWYVSEMKENRLEATWLVQESSGDEIVSERQAKQFLFMEDDHLVRLLQYDDGEEIKTVFYKTSSNVITKPSKSQTSTGKKCAKSGCNSKAVTTGDSVYCSKHSNRCLNCNCYIDGDAMFCMPCIRDALS